MCHIARLRTLWIAIILLSAMSAMPVPARGADFVLRKFVTVTVPDGVKQGAVNVYAAASSLGTFVDNPGTMTFDLNFNQFSIDKSAQAQTDGYKGRAAVLVERAIQGNTVITVPIQIPVEIMTPDNPPPQGGFAQARGFFFLRGGTVRVDRLTSRNISITNPLATGRLLTDEPLVQRGLQLGARAADPIHLVARNTVTGETIDTDIYNNAYFAQNGGSVGINASGQLELSIPASAATGAIAEFDSTTLVSYATNLTGSVELANGVLTASGIFNPDPTQPITNFWDVSYSPTNSSFITDATFLGSSVFHALDIAPQFANPATSGSDLVDLELYDSLAAEGFSVPVPEPRGIGMLAASVAIILAWQRYRRIRRNGLAG